MHEVISNEFFASVFMANQASHASCVPEPLGWVWGSKIPHAVRAEQVQDHVMTLNTYRSTWPDDKHPRVLKELGDVAAETLSIILEKSMLSGEIPGDWRPIS